MFLSWSSSVSVSVCLSVRLSVCLSVTVYVSLVRRVQNFTTPEENKTNNNKKGFSFLVFTWLQNTPKENSHSRRKIVLLYIVAGIRLLS